MSMPIPREHLLQVALVKWCREAIATPHTLLGFDRAKALGQFSHMREKARGVRAGTPDTLLIVAGVPPIWAELKAPGNRPTPEQEAMGDTLMRLGCYWSWVTTIGTYHAWMVSLGIRLHPNAELLATMADASVQSKIARAEIKAGKVPKAYKPREEKPTAARLRKLAAVRDRVRF
tara:strand:+ start:1063 stop:1587 length:525 start_codon:yes stop_codon:yes gene_type:complete